MILVKELSNISALRIPLPTSNFKHAWYKFYAYLRPEALASNWSRDRVLNELSLKGLPALTGSCGEIYMEKCFQNKGLAPKIRLNNASELSNNSLSFLIHPTITEEQMIDYSKGIKNVLHRAQK